MLSILVPIYNYDAVPLVEVIHGQGVALDCPFEIICLDDGSNAHYRQLNAIIRAYAHVRYELLPQNVGRAQVRNLLAAKAQYGYLLFMDCDMMPLRPDFLAAYQRRWQPNKVLCGGLAYEQYPPTDHRLRLRWRYGILREQQPASLRAAHPYHSFKTSNFLAPKALFQELQFEERLNGYGHEDTLFGFALQAAGIPISHLDNPMLHQGLEPAEVFLEKTKKAVANLHHIHQMKGFQIDTRLLNAYRQLERYRLRVPVRVALALLTPILKAQLRGRSPSIRALDLLKLYWLLRA